MWHRGRSRAHPGRRGGRGPRQLGGELTQGSGRPSDQSLVRSAVEAALAVAREDLAKSPPTIPPPSIRRYLAFTKLSTAAIQALARVLDHDDQFRSRVAAAVDEQAVGRAGWLWLTRPDGWQEEFAQLEAAATASAATAANEREERDARRRLAAARAAAERATAVATARAQEAAMVRADLAEEQAHRRLLEKHMARIEAQLRQASEERTTVVRQLKEVEVKLARRAVEAKEATARLRELERGATPSTSDDEAGSTLDPAALDEALATVVARSEELTVALKDLRQMVLAATPRRTPGSSTAGPTDRDTAPPVDRSPPPETPGRRTPIVLPGGMRDDSSQVVDFLLRTAGAWLLVDGYNVSMVGWPDLPVAEQRRRLVAALGETAARSGAGVKVVFDGAATEPWPLPRSARRLVSVIFSPAGVEADDVLLDLAARLPPARPVIVASSDNRVREGARRLGANLVHARQLLDAVRR